MEKVSVFLVALIASISASQYTPFTILADLDVEDVSKIEPYAFETMINETIQGLIANLTDPISAKDININLADLLGDLATGTLDIPNLEIAGLKGLQVPFLNLVMIGMRLNITLNVPVLDVKLAYALNASILNELPLYGNGDVDLDIHNLKLEIGTQFDLKPLALKNFQIFLGMDSLNASVTGFMNDEGLSKTISSMLEGLPSTLNDNRETVSQFLSPVLENAINSLLNGGNPPESTTESPTKSPTKSPTESPTKSPTESPTESPTKSPTKSPTDSTTESKTDSTTDATTPNSSDKIIKFSYIFCMLCIFVINVIV